MGFCETTQNGGRDDLDDLDDGTVLRFIALNAVRNEETLMYRDILFHRGVDLCQQARSECHPPRFSTLCLSGDIHFHVLLHYPSDAADHGDAMFVTPGDVVAWL